MVAEIAAEADSSRHFGFAGVNVFPDGEASLAWVFAEKISDA
jgi:hypothetical protein